MTACGGGSGDGYYFPPGPPDPRLLTSIPEGHHSHTSAVTEDGRKVVVAGGYESGLSPSQNVFTYDTLTQDTLDVAGSPVKADLSEPRALHTQTRVTGLGGSKAPRGSMLIVGGQSEDFLGIPYVSDTADVYDPYSDRFLGPIGNLSIERKNHTVTEIIDPASFYYGQFIVMGGQDNSGNILDTAEIFDPTTGIFTPLPARLTIPREEHTATSLPNGQILLAGGNTQGIFGIETTPTGEIFDTLALTFSPILGTMSDARRYHTATYLDNKTPTQPFDDAVLIAGGLDERGFTLASADFYDPLLGSFVPVNSYLPTPVFRHAAVALDYAITGDVALTGGFTSLKLSNTLRSDPTEQVVIFNYTYTGSGPDGYFVRTTNMLRARALHTTDNIRLRTLLTIGGVDSSGDPRANAEEFNY